MNNPFQVLGVSDNCTADELRRAYRALAKRWHPDRFMEGPEREWASDHMTEINAAYAECQQQMKRGTAGLNTEVNLDEVHAMIVRNRLSDARHLLLKSKLRSARWNFLFGTVLQAQGEVSKALTYFNFAVRQAPENDQYRISRDAAKQLLLRSRINGMLNSLRPNHTRTR